MKAPSFVDTNVLLYSIDPSDSRKLAIAAEILDRDNLVLSLQVLQEFVAQATNSRKEWAIPLETAAAFTRTWRRYPVVTTTLELFDRSLAIASRYHFSYWDSSILAAAALAGADTILTEDLQHDQVVEGIRVLNPFRDSR